MHGQQNIKKNKSLGTCEPLHLGFPEDGALAMIHVEILYVMYDFWLLHLHAGYCNSLQ